MRKENKTKNERKLRNILRFATIFWLLLIVGFVQAASPCSSNNPDTVYLGHPYPRIGTSWTEAINGVAHDQDHWFFSNAEMLIKFPVSFDLNTQIDLDHLPNNVKVHFMEQDLKDKGYQFFGDLDQKDGFLFVPLTGFGSDYARTHSAIAIYRASDLSLVGVKNTNQYTVDWVAFNPIDGYLYSSNSTIDSIEGLYSYEVDFTSLVSDVDKSITLRYSGKDTNSFHLYEADGSNLSPIIGNHIQGGVFTPKGDIYLINGNPTDNSNDVRGGIHVFGRDGRLIAESQNSDGSCFNYQYDPGTLSREEPEGIDYWDLSAGQAPGIGGQLHAILNDQELGDDNLDFKHYNVIYYGSISGTKYDDINGNGIRDIVEPGIPGWAIIIKKSDGTTESKLTDGDGNYKFDLPIGNYTVSEAMPQGWLQIAPTKSTTGSATYNVSISTSGENITDKDFGNFKLGEIHGTKFEDFDGNGIKDNNDTGIGGWTINLRKPDGSIESHVTDDNGNYEFDGLLIGNYTISEAMPQGWIQTAPAVSATGSSIYTVNISTSGQNEINKDFGNFKLGEIYGQKFEDINANTVKDKNESVLAGWNMTINGTDTITGTLVSSITITDTSGNYNFTGLAAGTYIVTETLKNGWEQTTPLSKTYAVTITSGSIIKDLNFGNFHKGKITGGGNISNATFGIVGQYPDKSNAAQGNVEYHDHEANLNIKSIQINTVASTLDKKKGVITGIAQVNGAGNYQFEIYVEDHGEPGKGADVFEISLSKYPYSNGTILSGGNIKIYQ